MAGDVQKQKIYALHCQEKRITGGKRSKCVTASMERVALLDW